MRTIGQANQTLFLATGDLLEQFAFNLHADVLSVTPRGANQMRRCLRPVGLFTVATPRGSYPELNLSMGRIAIEAGESGTRTYRPYSNDRGRTLEALYVGPEPADGDDPRFYHAVFAHFVEQIGLEPPGWLPRVARSASEADRPLRMEKIHHHAHGWLHLLEMYLLDLAVRASARPGQQVIEIGSYQGRSTSVIAAALADARTDGLVLSIDPNELSAQQATLAAANVAAVGQSRRLVQFQRTALALERLLQPGCAHMAFIDGSHEFADARGDFELCDRWLAPGGILVLHDVYPLAHLAHTPATLGPTRVVQEVILPTGRYTPMIAAHLTLALQKTA